LERWVTGLGGGVLLVAFHGAKIVGVAMVYGRPVARLRGIGELVIYIHQDYHGQGLGTFLTQTVLQDAKSRGFHRVSLGVVADNTPAVKVYERVGFQREGRLRDAFLGDDGKYHDQLVMGLIL
jgi:RimJ/RimL family protein N-acetyltransferase